MNPTLESLKQSGMQIRRFRSRLADNEDRARAWIKLAREEGFNDTEIRAALGFTVAEYNQLRRVA